MDRSWNNQVQFVIDKEATAMAATEVAFILQSGKGRKTLRIILMHSLFLPSRSVILASSARFHLGDGGVAIWVDMTKHVILLEVALILIMYIYFFTFMYDMIQYKQ